MEQMTLLIIGCGTAPAPGNLVGISSEIQYTLPCKTEQYAAIKHVLREDSLVLPQQGLLHEGPLLVQGEVHPVLEQPGVWLLLEPKEIC